MKNDQNPILNNPYEEPAWHYATNQAGELDYSRPVKGRRIFTPEIQSIPVRQGSQSKLLELNEVAAADYGMRKAVPNSTASMSCAPSSPGGTTPKSASWAEATSGRSCCTSGIPSPWRVKNAFLDFRLPYTDDAGEQRDYYPDFIVRCRNGEPLNLVLEITGLSKAKAAKKWTVENRWLPAVNRIRQQHRWDKWDFLEIADEAALADLRNTSCWKGSPSPQ